MVRLLSLIFAALVACAGTQHSPVEPEGEAEWAVVGATLIDATANGSDVGDLKNAVVLGRGERVLAIGRADELDVPTGARLIDGTGKFLVPGLVDGFATLNHQGYANAYLYHGVTSIIAVGGGRRGQVVTTSQPGPQVLRLESVGDEVGSTEEHLRALEELHAQGVRVALLMYQLTPDQLRAVVDRAAELGIATIGECAATSYAEADAAGVDAFVHITRFSLDMASAGMRAGIRAEPFSDDLASAKWAYYNYLAELRGDEQEVAAQAARFAAGSAALMPTLSLLGLDLPQVEDPWSDPAAVLLDADSIDHPADPQTGRSAWTTEQSSARARLALGQMRLMKTFQAAGARVLAGSGTDVWGTMPGISLHQELRLLQTCGMSPRQCLAAATGNFSASFGWSDVGSLRSGGRADLLLLASDPRLDVGALDDIDAICAAGEWLDRNSLLALSWPVVDGTIVDRNPFTVPAEYHVGGDQAAPYRDEYQYLDAVTIEGIVYMSDGLKVRGFLATPRAAGPHPCIISNRGGNREFGRIRPGRVVNLLARMASWGYVVAASQYRGVDGGEGLEEFGGAEVADVLNLIPLLEHEAAADPTRIGMQGGSRGGMMTLLALTRSDRIRAAVIRNGLSDLPAMLASRPEMGEVFGELIPAFANGDPAALESRSALHFADRIPKTTPILLLHGSADWRVPASQALDLAARLLEEQVPFRLLLLEGADHSLSGFTALKHAETRAWMDRYVRDLGPLPELELHGG